MNNKELGWIAGGLTALILIAGIGNNFFVNKVADKVIEKLKKDYSPSPYGPGLDPDVIDLPVNQNQQPKPSVNNWQNTWESQRR